MSTLATLVRQLRGPSSRPSRPRRSSPRLRPSVSPLEVRSLLSALPTLHPHTVQVPVSIAAQVEAFAQSHQLQQVGDGQCATLAADAVASAGGVPWYQLGPTGSNAAYVWGKSVTTLTPSNGNVSGIVPGDILQFTNVVMKDTMTIRYADGHSTTSTLIQSPSHHTAIVGQVESSSGANNLSVYQSDVVGSNVGQYVVQGGTVFGGTSTVTTHYTNQGSITSITVTHTMTQGTIQVYQPYKVVSETVWTF